LPDLSRSLLLSSSSCTAVGGIVVVVAAAVALGKDKGMGIVVSDASVGDNYYCADT